MNNSQNKTMDEIIAELQENIMDAAKGSCRLKIQYEKEFAQDGGEDVSDKLPSLTEALKLREENEKLKKDLDTNIEVRCNLETDVLKLASQIKKLKEENEEWRKVCEDFDTPGEVSVMIDDMKDYIKELQDADAMWRSMAKQQFGGDDGVWCATTVEVKIDNLKNQIPAKKGKKLSKEDKELLEVILLNVEKCWGPPEDEDEMTAAEYDEYINKKKLINRLLK